MKGAGVVVGILALAAVGAACAFLLREGPPQGPPAPPPEARPAVPPGSPGEPAPPPAPPEPEEAPASSLRMTFVRFPGGRATIGLTRSGFEELIRWSVLGRTSGVEEAIETELSFAVGEHAVELPPFLIGRTEVTSAQYYEFLRTAARVEVVVPPAGEEGPRTLEEISHGFLVSPKFWDSAGKEIHPVAVDWEGLYDLNEAVLTAASPPGKKPLERAAFRNLPLPPGLRILAYRHTVPKTWCTKVPTADGKERRRLVDAPPPGTENHPVTGVALTDAVAFAARYGFHVPTEEEWEACARGPQGEPWPTGEFEPLGMAWTGFNLGLLKAQPEARKKLAQHGEALRKNPGNGVTLSPEKLARCEWIVKAKEIEDPNNLEVPTYPVGLFPLGNAPCGAMDMLGNADEWVSTPLRPWPGTDSRSPWLRATSFVARGGNALDRDVFLTACTRKSLIHTRPLPDYARYGSLGFRVARYGIPGASAALKAVHALERAAVPVLPGWVDRKTRMPVFTGLDVHRAAGIEMPRESDGNREDPPDADAAEESVLLRPARSLCMVPANGVPWKDMEELDRAAALEVPDPRGTGTERRGPRDILFLGLLHLTDGMEIRAEVGEETVEEVPLDPAEARRARVPTSATRAVRITSYRAGVVRGGEHPEGLLLGVITRDGKRRPALWEARPGNVGTIAPGGSVLLEAPLALLGEGALAFRKVEGASKPFAAYDPADGHVSLGFFVPVEGRSDGFQVNLELGLAVPPEGR